MNLNFDHKSLNTKSLTSLCLSLQQFSKIDHLSLFSNHFGNEGVAILQPALLHSRIRRLSLAYNSITDAGLVATIIESNQYLKYVDLDENLIEEEGCLELISALQKNVNIVNLSIAGNPGLTSTVKCQLSDLLKRNRVMWTTRNNKFANLVNIARKLILLQLPTELKVEILKSFDHSISDQDLIALTILLDREKLDAPKCKERFEADILLRECDKLKSTQIEQRSNLVKPNSWSTLISKGNNYISETLILEGNNSDLDYVLLPIREVFSRTQDLASSVKDSLWSNNFTRYLTDASTWFSSEDDEPEHA